MKNIRSQTRKKGPVLYDLSKMEETVLNPSMTRKLIVGDKEMLAYFAVKKGAVASPHTHASEQITMVLKGAIRFRVNNKAFVVREGDVLVIPSNLEHSGVALEDSIDVDCFSPLRQDLLSGKDGYLRNRATRQVSK